MRRRTTRLVLAAVLTVGCAGAGGETEGEAEGETEPAASWTDELPEGNAATGLVSEQMRSLEVTEDMTLAGRALYARNCVPCHGEEGEGRLGTGPALNSETFLAAASDEYLVRTIGLGRPGTTMPPWGGSMTREEVESTVAFMRSWSDVEAAELAEGECEGDAEAGEATFREICAACHGRSGAGYMETSNGTGIGREAFLASTSNGYLRYIVENGKSNTPMRPFGRPSATAVANLTDDQVENVIAYLRANAW